jgi:hypothetical protein
LSSEQESLFSSSEWLKLYCSGVSLQAKTASANAKRRDAAPFWTWPRNQHRSVSVYRILLHPTSFQRLGFYNFPYDHAFVNSNWKRFHDALKGHQREVLNAILPRCALPSTFATSAFSA